MSVVINRNLGETHNGMLFQENMLTKKVVMSINKININMKSILEKYLNKTYTGKCFEEGYIEKDSVRVVSYTNGLCNANNLEFHVVFTCNICMVSDSMMLECKIENKNSSGIKCSVILDKGNISEDLNEEQDKTYNKSSDSLIIFCTRDHNNENKTFNELEVGDNVIVKVIGSKYELFDEYICVIGKFIKKN
jgi:DNA-directed RNA polymerase subunit E'/Rpb7